MGLHQLPTTLATLVTLANRRLSSVSTSNYGRGSWNTTCNYVLIFSINFQLRCYRLLLDNLQLYARSWQWRYINRSANLQQKTIEALKRIFWPKKCYFSDFTKTLRWKWAGTMVKRENPPNLGIHFLEGCQKQNSRFATVPSSLKKTKTCFYEHGFRSAGMYILRYNMI